MEPLKEMFNVGFYKQLAEAIKKNHRNFKTTDFVNEVTVNLAERSLNERLRYTNVVLKHFLPANYEQTLLILKKSVQYSPGGYPALVYPDFVALYGKHDFDLSMDALKYFTSFGSSEFAVREFLKLDFKRAIKYMEGWSLDKNHHVRRLSSEGSRPRLPWSFKLDPVIKDPSLTAKILNQLKRDDELYVRKSVANHLNDVSKENPDYMLNFVANWDQSNPNTAWIIRHASRTLIKKGHQGSLAIFNFDKNPKIKINQLKVVQPKLKLGQRLSFSFELVSEKKTEQKLVVDYLVHYVKKTGGTSAKVFKLKELTLSANQTTLITHQQLLKDFTTRKHFKGKHKIDIQINGKIMASTHFDLSI